MLLFLTRGRGTVFKFTLILISIIFFSFIYKYFGNLDKDFYHDTKYNIIQDKYIDYVFFSAQVQADIGFGDMIPKSSKMRIIVLIQVLITFFIYNLH